MPCAAARRMALEAMIPAMGTQTPDRTRKKWRITHWSLDAGGEGVAKIERRPSLNRLQAQSIW